MKNSNETKIGCGGLFPTLLSILFIYLKLTDQIDWSWWWVLSPLWIYVILIISVILFVLFIIIFIINGDHYKRYS